MRTCRGSSRIGRGDVGPFRVKGALVRRGEALKARYRVLVHDGDADAANVAGAYDEYLRVTR